MLMCGTSLGVFLKSDAAKASVAYREVSSALIRREAFGVLFIDLKREHIQPLGFVAVVFFLG